MATETGRSLREHIVRPGPTQDHTPLPSSGRAGRNLPAAVTTAVVLVGALGTTLVVANPLFVALVGVLCLGAVWELGGAFARVGVHVAMPPVYVGTVGILASAWTLGVAGALIAVYLTVFVIIAWRLLEESDDSAVRDIITSVFAVVYVPFLASFVILLLEEHRSALVVGTYVVVTIANDIGGWGVGVLFGRHPMIPRISPHKSWEGFAGSVLVCALVGAGMLEILHIGWAWGLLLGALGALVATIGDLTESMIKREVGLKDMSGLMPGHGGVLDRMDSLLMTAPVFYIVFRITLGG